MHRSEICRRQTVLYLLSFIEEKSPAFDKSKRILIHYTEAISCVCHIVWLILTVRFRDKLVKE
jgi:hypothetical protein